jgi:hypothetical protein
MTPLQITLTGRLTPPQLEKVFKEIEPELANSSEQRGLVVDCTMMTSYDMAARSHFVEWNKQWHPKINRVAIVTDKFLWHMVISVMATASGQNMKPFTKLETAIEWARR